MSDPWYRDGLRFECTQCGHCCSGTPGTVMVSEAEIATLATHLELAVDEFREIYTRSLRKGHVSLRERRGGECVFYSKGVGGGSVRGCSVYPSRPRQCRTWPFWRGVVHSEERWSEEATGCPGINRGDLVSCAQIRELSDHDGTRGSR